jgi:hypothetical protein
MNRRLLIFVPILLALLMAAADLSSMASPLGSLVRWPWLLTVYCVDDDAGTTGAPCANPTAYTSIQAAVNAAAPGDQIRIAAGSYGSTTYDRSLSLSGGYPAGPSGWSTPSAANVVKLTGAQNINTAVTVTAQDFLTLAADLNGPGALSIVGTVNWSGGNMNSGAAGVTGGAVLNIGGGRRDLNAYTVNNSGTVIWTSNNTMYLSNATINNNGGGTFDAQNDQCICPNGGTNAFNNNGGTFTKSAGAGTTGINVPFNTTASLHVGSGTLSLGAGGTGSGSFNVSSGAFLLFANNYTLNGGTFTGSGAARATAGTFTLNGTLNTQNFELAGSSLAGTHTIQGIFTWTGGDMAAGTTTISNGAVLNIGGGRKDLNSRAINNSGTINWTSNSTMYLSNGTIDNTGTFNAQNDQCICPNGGSNAFNNNAGGTFTKSGSTGTTRFDLDFNNFGGVHVQSGTLSLNGGSATGGSFDTWPGSVVLFTNDYTLDNATFTGAGAGRLTGGTLTATGVLSATHFELNGGTLTGNHTLNGTLNWTGGNISGIGSVMTTTIPSGSVLNIGGGRKDLNSRTISNSGTINWTSNGTMYLSNGTINNNGTGTFNVMTSQCICPNGGSNAFNNNAGGTLARSVVTGTTDMYVPFGNLGSAQVQTGTLSLNGGGATGGSFDVTSEAVVLFTSDYTLNNATFTGGGTGRAQAGTLTVNGTLNAPDFQLAGANLTGNHTINGTLSWLSGNMLGSGSMMTTTIPTGSVLNIGGGRKDLSLRTISNSGTINWTSNGTMYLSNGTINNNAGSTFTARNDQCICPNGGSNAFNNGGAFVKSAGAGETLFGIEFFNSGSAQVQTGTLTLNGGGSSSGSFDVFSGLLVRFTNNYALNNATFTGAGQARLVAGTLTANGSLSAPNFELTGGTFTGSHTINGTLNWTGGTFSSGNTTIAGPSVLNIGGGRKDMADHTLNIQGTANWTSNDTFYLSNVSINNSGLFNAENDRCLCDNGGTNAFNNVAGGAFAKSIGTGDTTIQAQFNNAGLVDAQSGRLAFAGPFTQTAGSTRLNGGSVSTATTLNFQGGALTGAGAITGNVSNSGGQVAPGASPGIISISGSYTQGPAGALNIEIGGYSPGTQFDRLDVGGPATLNGTLNAALINGFVPNNGDTFRVMNYASRTGSFTLAGARFTAVYNPDNLTLVYAGPTATVTPSSTPAPPTLTSTSTPSDTPTPSRTVTPTNTPSSTSSATRTPTGTTTPTSTNTATRTPTLTSTVTQTSTGTITPVPTDTATASRTNTSTATNTLTATATGTSTQTRTATVTSTNTSTVTGTRSPTLTTTGTQTASVTPTITGTATQTATGTPTLTRTSTATTTATRTATVTITATITATNTGTATRTATATSTVTTTASRSATRTSTSTGTATITSTGTTTATDTPTAIGTSTEIATVTVTPTVTSTVCPVQFTDVPEGSAFHPFIRCLACLGFVSGYNTAAQCGDSVPCFRPASSVTRGQLAKIVANAAGVAGDPGAQIFTDVPPGSPFYAYINRLANRGILTGYDTPERCPGGIPCFLPSNNASRGQISKIVANAAGIQNDPGPQVFTDVPPGSPFYSYINRLANRGVMSGYDTPERCPGGIPCFHPEEDASRGQSSKIVSNTFYPNCQFLAPTGQADASRK